MTSTITIELRLFYSFFVVSSTIRTIPTDTAVLFSTKRGCPIHFQISVAFKIANASRDICRKFQKEAYTKGLSSVYISPNKMKISRQKIKNRLGFRISIFGINPLQLLRYME